ncbi:MAG: CpaF/VirB11 family protein [Bacilli bacterium]|nr:CpaF/VirB11 family protein [Bacilli bacterium]
MLNSIFDQMEFGPLEEFLQDDDVTDVSYSNGGQVWLKTLSSGIKQVKRPEINNAFMEKLAFQCSNVMGKTFNMAHPFLDAESAELRMNFVHDSIATNGIAVLLRKTPAKIRLNKDKLLDEQYATEQLHDFLIKCVEGHANILVAGETGSGKTELVKYLASKTKYDEKIITIEDTLELHLDKIFPERDIVAMKTNNIASYTEALVACMRQNPIWILLSEVRSAEAVLAVRNSISSGHHILSTIHADNAANIPLRLYSLLESSQDIDQFVTSFHRYIQIGIYVKGYFSKRLNRFQREIIEVCSFYVDENNQPGVTEIYRKGMDGKIQLHNPDKHLLDYLAISNVMLPQDTFGLGESGEGVQDAIEEAKKYDEKIGKEFNGYPTPPAEGTEEKKDENKNSEGDMFNMNGENTIHESSPEQVEQAKKDAEDVEMPKESSVTPEVPIEKAQVVQTKPTQVTTQVFQTTSQQVVQTTPQQVVQTTPQQVTVQQPTQTQLVQPATPVQNVQPAQAQPAAAPVQPVQPAAAPVLNDSIISPNITGNLGGGVN